MTEGTECILTLPLGDIRGQTCVSIYDQSYLSFEGIPFAEPPLGPLRFRSPKPAKKWEGTKNCTKCGNKPLQLNLETNTVEGSEDCLYLNVYTKKLISERPLPVMVFIYGGGFRMGEASRNLYSPDYFMNENVVLITFNYRLCSLGFISFADPNLHIPGNAGLKDQALALKWVKEYISYFNGDSKNVTVFGESAGAASTHYLMLSEQGRDLFRRAICMSGTAMNYWAHMPQRDMAYRLARYHGYDGQNHDTDVYTYLNALEPNKLVTHSLLNEEELRSSYMFAFGPIIEPYTGDDCFIPDKPLNMLKDAWSNNIAMMLGGSSFEGLLLYREVKRKPSMMRRFFNEPELIVPEEVRSKHGLKHNRQFGERLLKLHFSPASPDDSSLFKYLEIYSFKIFWHDIHRTVLARLAFARAPTFLYRFDFDSPDFNLYRNKYCSPDKIRGVAHADELSYIFLSNDSSKLLPHTDEYKMLRRMIGMWTAYATSGDPDCEETKPIVWDAVTKYKNLRALNINKKLEFQDLPEKEKLEVWAKLYPNVKHLCGASSEEEYYWGEPMPTMT